ncbi:MAG TPA: hypothetical protein VMQ65_04185 [Candidatus Limnocylindria bacterium]|nr:hypothetical protein [Candidatus Limnocylindria bacterium]
MKRLGLALVLATAVGSALAASAASLGGITSTLGADDAAVSSCDSDGVIATYRLAFTSGLGFTVSEVHVSGTAAACNGKWMDVVLTRDGAQLGAGSATVSSTGLTVVTMPAGILARDVNDIHIAIN